MNQMRELMPCPFCGGPVDIEKTIDGRKWYGVVCRNTFNRGGSCAVSIRPSASEECAIERWNMRAQSVSVPVVGDVVAWVSPLDIERIQANDGLNVRLTAGKEAILISDVPLYLKPTTSISAAELERLQQCEDVLRSLACSLSAGGYNADVVDPVVFEKKIRDGIDMLIAPLTSENERLQSLADSGVSLAHAVMADQTGSA